MPEPRRITPAEERRLATAYDPMQRATLRAALERGDPAPDFAWRPNAVSEVVGDAELGPMISALADELRPLAEARGMSIPEYSAWMERHEDEFR